MEKMEAEKAALASGLASTEAAAKEHADSLAQQLTAERIGMVVW